MVLHHLKYLTLDKICMNSYNLRHKIHFVILMYVFIWIVCNSFICWHPWAYYSLVITNKMLLSLVIISILVWNMTPCQGRWFGCWSSMWTLSSDPQHPVGRRRCWKITAHTYNPSVGEVEARGPLELTGWWAPGSRRDPASRTKKKSEWRRDPAMTSGFHTCAHIHTCASEDIPVSTYTHIKCYYYGLIAWHPISVILLNVDLPAYNPVPTKYKD